METVLQVKNQKLDFYDYIKKYPLVGQADDTHIVRCYGTSDNPLFMAKDVAKILGYKNPAKSIRDHVDLEDRFQLENEGENESFSHNSQPHSILINESGLYCLILRSKKPEAIQFRKWVTKEVLPAIRKKGQYSVLQRTEKDEIDQQLNIIQKYTNLLQICGMDDRDKILIKDMSKNSLIGNNFSLTETKSQNTEWSISKRLTEHFYVTNKKAHKKLIAFGKILASEYRKKHNENPPQREQFVSGTIRKINCYYLNDWEEGFDDLMEEYFSEYIIFEDEEE